MGKALDKAKKKFWYDSNFDKQDNHLEHHLDTLIFTQGWKVALEWALSQQEQIDWRFSPAIQPAHIKEELEETDNERKPERI